MKREIRFTAAVFVLALMTPLCVFAEAGDSEVSDREYIEKTLNLANNEDQEWTYSRMGNSQGTGSVEQGRPLQSSRAESSRVEWTAASRAVLAVPAR